MALHQQNSGAPEQRQIAKNYFKNARKFGIRFGWHPIKNIVTFLNKINGLLTAIATIGLVALTYVIANDANKQDASSNRQLGVMQGQLNVMKEQAALTMAQLAPSIKLIEYGIEPLPRAFPLPGIWITPNIINNGGTTAKHVFTVWKIVIEPIKNDPSQFCGIPKSSYRTTSGFDIAPQQTVAMASEPLSTAAIKAVTAGKLNIILTIHITYGEVFDKAIQTIDWCNLVVPDASDGNYLTYPMLEGESN